MSPESLMFEYTCPECKAVLKSAVEAPAGRKIRCKKCSHAFVPGGGFALKEEAAPAPVTKKPLDDDDNDTSGYGLHADEAKPGNTTKIKFDDVADKFKRSTRGPAMALMVLPTNLLVAQGGLMFIFGVFTVLYGMFPLVFAEVEPSEDEYREQAGYILFGLLMFIWGCLVCFGASKMQNLESYTWGMVGAIAGFPAGIFALVMLRNPRVVSGFKEMEGAISDEEGEGDDDDDDDDEEDDDE